MAFGPQIIGPSDSDGIIAILIGLLLPAVQADTSANVQVILLNADMRLVIPIPSATYKKGQQIEVFVTLDEKGQKVFNARNVQTKKLYKATSKFSDVTIQVRWDDRASNGLLLPANFASATVFGKRTMKMGDGSVLPFPIQYALPAVQYGIIGEK